MATLTLNYISETNCRGERVTAEVRYLYSLPTKSDPFIVNTNCISKLKRCGSCFFRSCLVWTFLKVFPQHPDVTSNPEHTDVTSDILTSDNLVELTISCSKLADINAFSNSELLVVHTNKTVFQKSWKDLKVLLILFCLNIYPQDPNGPANLLPTANLGGVGDLVQEPRGHGHLLQVRPLCRPLSSGS